MYEDVNIDAPAKVSGSFLSKRLNLLLKVPVARQKDFKYTSEAVIKIKITGESLEGYK